jgi:hypothetical protein
MILTVRMEGISKAATVLSVLMIVYIIPCHDRGYINVMLVLQSCTDPLHIPPCSCSEIKATSDGVCNITSPDIKSEPDEVSYVCICLLLDTFYQCPGIFFVFCGVTVFGQLKQLDCWE